MGYPDPEVQYEYDLADNQRRRGPLRFEEGIATDTDVPRDFQQGAYGDTQGTEYGGWATVTKSPAETMKERAHLGSSTWIEAPSLLAEFVQGAHTGMMPPSFEREYGSEGRIHRINRANVPD